MLLEIPRDITTTTLTGWWVLCFKQYRGKLLHSQLPLVIAKSPRHGIDLKWFLLRTWLNHSWCCNNTPWLQLRWSQHSVKWSPKWLQFGCVSRSFPKKSKHTLVSGAPVRRENKNSQLFSSRNIKAYNRGDQYGGCICMSVHDPVMLTLVPWFILVAGAR